MNPLYQRYQQELTRLKQADNHRCVKPHPHQGDTLHINHRPQLNLSANDYLGIAQKGQLQQTFLSQHDIASQHFSSSSSRLLTGSFPEHQQLEASLNNAFGRSSLLFNSGYHMNIGILPALSDAHTLIVSDELIHASMIDGIRLSKAQRKRFPHCDLHALENCLKQAQDDSRINKVIVVTESVFSMDGDMTDLKALVALKKAYPKTLLYVDEAHAVGVYGERGLGCAEAQGCLHEIDFLLGTFGKALASAGGYLVCDAVIRDYLINKSRSLIFSTALPPVNVVWTNFVFTQMQQMNKARQQLHHLSSQLKNSIREKGLECPSDSHIVPIIYGDNATAIQKANACQQAGFYVMPIRPPTVAPGRSRIRLCLHAGLTQVQLTPLEVLL